MTGPPPRNGNTVPGDRFSCTPAGVIATSRRRFSAFLMPLALLMVVATLAMGLAGRLVPALLAAGVGIVVLMAWRMSRELSPQWLEVSGGELTVQTASIRFEILLDGAFARPLEREEIAHLGRLASTAGLVTGVGGFDSHLLGEFDLYATDLDHAVLIESGEDRFVITPDNPGEFLAAAAQAGANTQSPLLQSTIHE
jgi:hypothetical protein